MKHSPPSALQPPYFTARRSRQKRLWGGTSTPLPLAGRELVPTRPPPGSRNRRCAGTSAPIFLACGALDRTLLGRSRGWIPFKLRGGLSSVISTLWNCTDGCLQTFQHSALDAGEENVAADLDAAEISAAVVLPLFALCVAAVAFYLRRQRLLKQHSDLRVEGESHGGKSGMAIRNEPAGKNEPTEAIENQQVLQTQAV